MNLLDCLERHADKILAVCDDGREYHYADLLELAARFSSRIPYKRLVFCLCSNDAASLLGYLALLRADAVPAMLNVNILPDRLARLYVAYRPAFLWLPQARAPEFGGTREVCRFLDYVLLATDDGDDYPILDELALLLTTSGSTGSPMFVRQSRRNLISNAESIAAYLGITSDDRPITTLPLSYTYGLSIIHSHLLYGCTLALTARTFFDRAFWDFLKATRATTFGGVPYHYEILKKLRFWRMNVPNLRTLTQAGGRMDPALSLEVTRECAHRQIRYFTMYGQVEATARMSYLAPERAVDKAGSIGMPIPGGEFWIEDEQGKLLTRPEATGQLVFKGENVTLGYAENCADLARGDDNRGVLHTGDLARRDRDGYYYIVGRQKRFVKLFGHRVNLQDLENELQRAGHEVACGGCDDHLRVYVSWGNRESGAIIKEQVIEWLKAHPSAIVVVGIDDFPRNDAGKLLYSRLETLDGEVLA